MKRWIAVFISVVFVSGCSGMGGGGNRFLPGTPQSNTVFEKSPTLAADTTPSVGGDSHRGPIPVTIRMHIPRRHRGERTPMHPAVISSLTQSVSIAVNGGKAKIYNATPSSPNCSAGPSGTTCSFKSAAPPGGDTFAVKTFSGAGGTGSVLDYGTAVVNIARGKSNAASVSLGPVVSTTADSGMGSLRFAIASAGAGDTVMFLLPAGSTVVLSSPITINSNVGVAGPGVTASARRARIERNGRRSAATYSGVSISGNNANQIFVINPGGSLTVSGMILTSGQAAVAHNPGGAIANNGALTLVNDVVTANTSLVKTVKHVHNKKKHAHHVKPLRRGERPQPVPLSRMAPDGLHPHVCPPGTNTYGGAVYNDGLMNVSGTIFDGNIVPSSNPEHCYAGYGGAVYNDTYGVLDADNTTFTNNSAYEGGAIYSYSEYGSVTLTNDKFLTNTGCDASSGCVTSGCTPSGTCSSRAVGYGAAVYDDYSPGLNVSNTSFTGNAVGSGPFGYGEGGALYLDNGSPVITNSTFTGNTAGSGTSNKAEGYGGAIVHYDNTLTLNGDTFTGNQAGGDYYGQGGAMYSDEYVVASNDTFTGNVASGAGSPSYTDATSEGGALYCYYCSFANSTFSNNSATSAYESYGGAVYIYEYSTFTNDTFTSNQAVGTGSTGAYPYVYGGAIYLDDSLNLSGSTFTSNVAKSAGQYAYYAYGGAIYLASSYQFNSSKNTYTSNSATATGGYLYAYAYGGAIASYGYVTSNGDTFKSNVAAAPYDVYGGAIYADSVLTMGNGVVSGNTATGTTYTYGGGLYTDSGNTTTVTNTTFASNAATSANYQGYGGGIYDDSNGTYNGVMLTANTATTGGAGFYADNSGSINTSVMAGNAVTQATNGYGGGGLFNDGPATVSNSAFIGNAVTVAGAFAGGGGVFDDDALSMTGSTISGNKTIGSGADTGGGGLFEYSDAYITNSTITGNTSSTDGGGIENESSSLSEYANVTVFQNVATGGGGNVNNLYTMELANSVVAGGTAGTGADVNNLGTLTTGDYNVFGTPVGGGGTFTPATHDLYANPKLLALTNNGGPTMTNADQAISPGKAYIPFAASMCNGWSGTNVDQRGFTRGAGGKCDAGAFEFGGTPSAIKVRAPKAHESPHHKHRLQPHEQRHATPNQQR